MNFSTLLLLACCLCGLLTPISARELSQVSTSTRSVSSGSSLTSSTTTQSTLSGTTLSRRFPSGFGSAWWRPAVKPAPIKPLLPTTTIQPTTPIQPTPAQPTTPVQPTTPSNPANPMPVSSDGGCPDPEAALSAMNAAPACRGSPPLTWSAELARGARSWSAACVFQHSHNGQGENLAKFSSPSATLTDAVNLWLAEERMCPCTSFSPSTGHYTQIVWRASTTVGCGCAPCGGGMMATCRYTPAGNVMGAFAANV